MIRQQLTIKQQQRLSPLQVQQVKMLELNSLEIENRILHELEENPALEEAPLRDEPADSLAEAEPGAEPAPDNDALPVEGVANDEDIADYIPATKGGGKADAAEMAFAGGESLSEHLIAQLRLKKLTPEHFKIGEYIVGNLDDNGYLQRDVEAMRDDLAFRHSLDVEADEITAVLHAVQDLDPPGVGAANLRDCLLLQLRRKARTPLRERAIELLERYFEPFSKRQYDALRRHMQLSEQELRDIIREITLLNPKPGNSWENNVETRMGQISPDFYVETIGNDIVLSMADSRMPSLRINDEYRHLQEQYERASSKGKPQREALAFVKDKIENARWFIDALQQRNTTLQRTMAAIIRLQRDFFLSGDESELKPMLLKDVAEASGYDVSTSSRVCGSKYVQTNWGVFPLRYFFSEQAATTTGEEVSVREIKNLLRGLVTDEEKSRPLTDDALTDALRAKGFDIARRTVAKYREQLNIPPARLRKEA